MAAAAAPKSVCEPDRGEAEVADAGGLEEIEANDWAGDGKMLGDTEADDAEADCMLELGDAEPVDDGCDGYCISNFIGLHTDAEIVELEALATEEAGVNVALLMPLLLYRDAELLLPAAAPGDVVKSVNWASDEVAANEAVA